MISFEDFLNKVDEAFYTEKLRYGQTIMNTLYRVWPEKYNEISGGDFDCFYDDRAVRSILDKLQKEWVV